MNEKSSTPRVAESLDDLRAGMVVATVCADGSAGECITFLDMHRFGYDAFMRGGGRVVILSDPPPEPVRVPADLIDALAEALAASAGMRDPAIRLDTISYAARALVDAARNGTDQ